MLLINGDSIVLKEIEESDIKILHSWRNDKIFTGFCSTRRNLVSMEEFTVELKNDFAVDRHLQCIIRKVNEPIGTIYAYNLNRTDGFIFFTIYLLEKYEKSGYGVEAVTMFMLYLFNNLPLHKIYADVYSYNIHSIKILRKSNFIEEGKFVGHRLYQEKRYDLIRFSFFRNQLPKLELFFSKLTAKTRGVKVNNVFSKMEVMRDGW